MTRVLVVLALAAVACGNRSVITGKCGVHTDGTFHISPIAEDLRGCSYTQADERISIDGYDPLSSAAISFVAPAGVGTFHCVPGTDLITIVFRDETGVRFSAVSNDGTDTRMSGDCTITTEVSDTTHWSGHVDATLSEGGSTGHTIPFTADVALIHL